MSLLTTWTTAHVPTRRTIPSAPEPRAPHDGPRPAWDCANCAVLNPGVRKRCTDCGTTRD
ncbi:MAG: hypothetical protein JWM64_2531 [Frankiales bacterium]|nr:hypothetical protein [Frankiales bacterium]